MIITAVLNLDMHIQEPTKKKKTPTTVKYHRSLNQDLFVAILGVM